MFSRPYTYQQNIIYNIGHTCMLSGGWWVNTAERTKIFNNTAYNCGVNGLWSGNDKDAQYKNNIIMNSGRADVTVWDKSVTNGGNVFQNNLYYTANRTAIGNWFTSCPNGCGHPTATLTLSQFNSASG
jgi:hypothetical protein